MTRKEVFEIIERAAVELLEVEPGSLTEATSFTDDLEADSLDLVEFLMVLEDELNVSVPQEQLAGIVTVGDALDLVLVTAPAA